MEFAGGAFVVDGESRLSVIDSNFTNVGGGLAGGVFASNSGIIEISGSRCEGATSGIAGALIAAGGSSTLTLRDSIFRDIGTHGSWSWNTILLYDGVTATISGCRFEASQKGVLYVAKVRAPHPHTQRTTIRPVFARPWPPSHPVPSSWPKASAVVDNCHFEGIEQDRGSIASITQGGSLRITSSTIISRTTYSSLPFMGSDRRRSLFLFSDGSDVRRPTATSHDRRHSFGHRARALL